MDTKQIGNLTELQCIARFYELGYSVSIPYGDSEKYDFIVDINNHLYRLQCKHAQIGKNLDNEIEYIKIRTTWSSGYTRNTPSKRNLYTKEDCDFFVTFFQGKNYLVPVEECSSEKRLRISPPKNGQIMGVHFLKDYVDEEVCKQL